MKRTTGQFTYIEYVSFFISLSSVSLLLLNGFNYFYLSVVGIILFAGFFEHSFFRLKYIFVFTLGALVSDVFIHERFVNLPIADNLSKTTFLFFYLLIMLFTTSLSYFLLTNTLINNKKP